MDLSLRTEYWGDPEARRAFREFLVRIHGLDLSEWESRGFWDPTYTPFSFFEGDRIVASVCVYSLAAVVDRRPVRLAQISGVGTLPEWRRRGLNRRLTEAGLAWAGERHQGVFLFSSAEAIPFYRACGFKPMDEYLECIEARAIPGRAGAIRLDPGSQADLDRIYRYAKRRVPVSHRLGVLNPKLLMFHVLHTLRGRAYEVPDLECLVFMDRKDGCLKLFDIVGERIPRFEDLHPFIAYENDRTVEFHFHTDRLGLDRVRTMPLHGNHPFVREGFPVERPVFPFTSRA
jgi:GNAT superfamily N-acetyltransferase